MALKPNAYYPQSLATDTNGRIFEALIGLSSRIDAIERNPAVGPAGILNANIAPGAVQTGSLAANSVVASHIVSGTITGDKMATRTLTADKIAVGAIDAASAVLADAVITTAKIADLAVVDAKIANISGDKVDVTLGTFRTAGSGARVEISGTGLRGYNSSSVLKFGFDTTTGIATVGAIVVTGTDTQVPASTLTGFLGGGNLLKDSSFESVDPATPGSLWSSAGGVISKQTTQAFHGSKSLRVLYGAPAGQAFSNVRTLHGVPITSLRNRPVVFSAWVYVTGTDNTTPATNKAIGLSTDTVTLASVPIASIPKDTWTRVIVKDTVPSGAADFYVSLFNPYSSGSNTVYFDGIQLELGDAATAYNPKADEIIYGSITSLELAANSVTASSVAAGAIDGKTITGAIFQTQSANPKVAFDSTGFYVTDASGNKDLNVTAAGGIDLLAGTSTNPPVTRRLRFLRASDGVVAGAIFAYASAGIGHNFFLESVGSTATEDSLIKLTATSPTSTHGYADLSVVSATGVGQKSRVIANAANGAIATILNEDQASSFLQLATLANKKIAFGSTAWSKTAAVFVDVTITHGLGAAATGAWAIAQGGQQILVGINSINPGGTNTQVTFRLAESDNVARTDSGTLYWIAVA